MLAAIQYSIYFIAGMFLIFIMGTYFSVAAAFSVFAYVLVFLPLLLAGYASGLSLFYPRAAAVAGIILILPILVSGVYRVFVRTPYFEPAVFIVPSTVAVLISVSNLVREKPSLWSRQKESAGKIMVGISAGLPAFAATLLLVSSVLRMGKEFIR